MPKTVLIFKYSADGYRGLLKEGAVSREATIRKAYEAHGGVIESVYWTNSGAQTGFVIGEIPEAAGLALLTAVGASGAFADLHSVAAFSSAEMDAALKIGASYRPPGG